MILRKLLPLLIIVVPLLVLVLILVFFPVLESFVLFHPARDHVMTPGDIGLEAEELMIESDGSERIHAYFASPSNSKTCMLFSHGNGGNISSRLPLVKHLVDREISVLTYDYRGYGKSSGSVSTTGIFDDSQRALATLVGRCGDQKKIVLFGRSLGGGVSYEVASRHPELDGIITDATFTSIPDVAKTTIFSPFAGLIRTQMNNLERIADLDMPKLIIHGTDDDLIPFEMAQRLFKNAKQPAKLVKIQGAGHNNTYLLDPELYFGAIQQFVDELPQTTD